MRRRVLRWRHLWRPGRSWLRIPQRRGPDSPGWVPPNWGKVGRVRCTVLMSYVSIETGVRCAGAASRPPAGARVRITRRAGATTPHPPFAFCANRSATRAATRAFRGVNGLLPTRAALRFSRAGPFHLLHGALAPALVRGAVGLARRKTDAGQEPVPRRLQRRGMNSHERLPRNWSRRGPFKEGEAWVQGHGSGSRRVARPTGAPRPGASAWPGCRLPACRPEGIVPDCPSTSHHGARS